MPISLKCQCGKELKASETLAGKRGHCPRCGTLLLLPDALSSPAPAVPLDPVRTDASPTGRPPQITKSKPPVEAGPTPTSRRHRLVPYAIASFVAIIVLILVLWSIWIPKLSITECYVLDAAVLNKEYRQLSAVLIAVRTRPEADRLDLEDMRLITSDGTTFPAGNWLGEPVAQAFGATSWILFVVPETYLGTEGLRIETKSGAVISLPDAIPKKSIDEIIGAQ